MKNLTNYFTFSMVFFLLASCEKESTTENDQLELTEFSTAEEKSWTSRNIFYPFPGDDRIEFTPFRRTKLSNGTYGYASVRHGVDDNGNTMPGKPVRFKLCNWASQCASWKWKNDHYYYGLFFDRSSFDSDAYAFTLASSVDRDDRPSKEDLKRLGLNRIHIFTKREKHKRDDLVFVLEDLQNPANNKELLDLIDSEIWKNISLGTLVDYGRSTDFVRDVINMNNPHKSELYIYAAQQPGTLPLHRYRNLRTGKHFVTISPQEQNQLESNPKEWERETKSDPLGYIYPNPPNF